MNKKDSEFLFESFKRLLIEKCGESATDANKDYCIYTMVYGLGNPDTEGECWINITNDGSYGLVCYRKDPEDPIDFSVWKQPDTGGEELDREMSEKIEQAYISYKGQKKSMNNRFRKDLLVSLSKRSPSAFSDAVNILSDVSFVVESILKESSSTEYKVFINPGIDEYMDSSIYSLRIMIPCVDYECEIMSISISDGGYPVDINQECKDIMTKQELLKGVEDICFGSKFKGRIDSLREFLRIYKNV